jgi:hypothetical protein
LYKKCSSDGELLQFNAAPSQKKLLENPSKLARVLATAPAPTLKPPRHKEKIENEFFVEKLKS